MHAKVALAHDVVTFALPAPDADTARRIQDLLMGSMYASLRASVRCRCVQGVATLTGRVPSFFLKQMAQSFALSVAEVHEVVNAIRVESVSR
jgi:osmotically-inducible protein OsmY